jgi:predicted nucleic acid-binding protein
MRHQTPRFLDANIIMYALGGPHPLQQPCRKILEQTKSGTLLLVSDTEVLQEILYRYFSIQRAALAETAYTAVKEMCVEILPVTIPAMDRALDLLKNDPTITSRDAVHAAVMLLNGLRVIISTDAHFDRIPGIRRLDPVQN